MMHQLLRRLDWKPKEACAIKAVKVPCSMGIDTRLARRKPHAPCGPVERLGDVRKGGWRATGVAASLVREIIRVVVWQLAAELLDVLDMEGGEHFSGILSKPMDCGLHAFAIVHRHAFPPCVKGMLVAKEVPWADAIFISQEGGSVARFGFAVRVDPGIGPVLRMRDGHAGYSIGSDCDIVGEQMERLGDSKSSEEE